MSSRKKVSRNQKTATDMEKTDLNKRQAKDVSKTWSLQQKNLDSNIKQMSVLHKSVLGNLDAETNKMKVHAEKLIKQQLRLAEDDNPKEQTLRAELGLERRRSSINPHEVLNAAQALGLPSFENGRRSSFSGVETLSPAMDGARRRSSVRSIADGEYLNARQDISRRKSVQGDTKRGSFAREQCRSAAPRRNARFSTQPDPADTTESDDDYIEIPAITISAPDDNNDSSPTCHTSTKNGTSHSSQSHVTHKHNKTKQKTPTIDSPTIRSRPSKQHIANPNLMSKRKSISSTSKSPSGRRKSSAIVTGSESLNSPDANQPRRSSMSRRLSRQLRPRTEKELKHPQVRANSSGSDSEGSQNEQDHEESSDLHNQLKAVENCRYLRRKSDADRELTINEIFAKD